MAKRKAVVDFEIHGQEGLNSIEQLTSKTSALRKEWVNATDAADRYQKFMEFEKSNNELKRHRQMVNSVSSSWDVFKTGFSSLAGGVFAGNMLTNIIESITGKIGELISNTSKVSDELADVKKNTGLLDSEIDLLNDSLDNIDTRTARSELRKLGAEAGKLGKESIEDVQNFIDEADKVKVALGEDLGDDAIIKIGKLSDVFKTSMLSIGSSINTVGAKSTAAEQYLVDFTSRMGGTAITAKISAPDIIGYAAVLDQLGLQVEMSGTAMSTFFIDFLKNTTKFERAAGMQEGSLEKLIGEKGTNEGFLGFIENLKNASKSESDFLQRLDQVGIDGSRGAAVFLSLANNIGKVKEQQAIANEEFTKGTSILNEFNVKNNTQAAILEKIGKWWEGYWSGGMIRSAVESLVTSFGKLVGVVSETDLVTRQYFEAKEEMKKMDESIVPLLDRYDQLREKTHKSVFDTDELEKIFAKINNLLPGYKERLKGLGDVWVINSDKARLYIDSQKEIMRQQNIAARNEIDKEVKKIENDRKEAERRLKFGKNPIGSAFVTDRSSSSKELSQIQSEINAMNKKRGELLNTRKELWEEQMGVGQEKRKAQEGVNLIKDLNDQIHQNNLSAHDREILSVRKKYEALRFEHKKNSEVLKGLSETEQKEIEQVNAKYMKSITGFSGGAKSDQQKKTEKVREELKKLNQAIEIDLLNDSQKQVKIIENKYDELLKDVKKGSQLEKEIRETKHKELQQLDAIELKKRNQLLYNFDEEYRRSFLSDQEKEVLAVKDKYDSIINETRMSFEEIRAYAAKMQGEIDGINTKYKKKDNEQDLSNSLAWLDDEKEKSLFNLDMQATDPFAYQEGINAQKLQIELDYLLARQLMLETYGEMDVERENQLNDRIREIQLQKRQSEVDLAIARREELRQLREAETDLQMTKLDLYSQGISALRGFFKETSGIHKAMFLAEKALIIARIIIGAQQEVQNLREASSAQEKAVSAIPYVGVILANVIKAKYAAKILMTRVNAGIAVGTVAAQSIQTVAAKEDGGYTDRNSLYGYTKGPTFYNYGARSYIAGESGREFVISGDALARPEVATMADLIDNAQKTGDYSPFKKQLGSDMTGTNKLLDEVKNKLDSLTEAVVNAGNRPIQFNYSQFEEAAEFITEIKQSVTA